MSRYGITVYGTDLYGEVVDNDFDASPFTAEALDYSSARLNWRTPGGSWDELRLVRNSNGYPLTVEDGTTVLHEAFGDPTPINVGTASGGEAGSVGQSLEVGFNVESTSTRNTTEWIDTGLTSGRFYYYALFAFDRHLLVWRPVGSTDVLVPKTFGYTDRLFQRLPEVFRSTEDVSLGESIADVDSFLYRYLSIVGYQLDFLRTEYDSLRGLLDARTVSYDLLPILAEQVGIKFEPQIGSRAVRRLVQNAVHLYGLKGTNPGIRELASIVTGWPASVRIGYNLALDDLDAGPKGSEGRWTGYDGSCHVGYAANRTRPGPVGTGVLDILAVGGRPDCIAWMNGVGSGDGHVRLQYAIPVAQGRTYTVSQFAASEEDDSDVNVRMRINWIGVKGEYVADFVDGDDQPCSSIFTARPFLTATAPVGARYAECSIVFTKGSGNFTAGERVRACGFMLDEHDGLRPWQCAREIIVNLQGELINQVLNPNAAVDTFDWEPYGDGVVGLGVDSGEFHATGSGTEVGMVKQASIPTNPSDRTWYITAEVKPSADCMATLSVVPTSGGVDQTLQLVTTQAAGADEWTKLEGFYTVPADGGIGGFKPVIVGADGDVRFRNILAVKSATRVDYFDGGLPTPTSDNLWQGVEYRSPSHHYTQRTHRAYRLRQLLRDFIPYQSCYTLEFAQAPSFVVGSPAAIEGYDINPGVPAAPPPVGRSLELRWNDIANNSKSLELRWNIETLKVGAELDIQWAQTTTVGASLEVQFNTNDLSGAVGTDLQVRWNTLQTLSYGVQQPEDSFVGMLGARNTDGWNLVNDNDTDYIYPGSGPMYQTGSVVEVSLDRETTFTDSFPIPNVGDTYHHAAHFGTPESNVAEISFFGASGELLYYWSNGLADWRNFRQLRATWRVFTSPGKSLGLLWNINDTGYADGYAGGY